MKPEIFFLRYAFPCSFILLASKEITKKENELLYKSAKEEKLYLSKKKIESIFWRAVNFIGSISNSEKNKKYWRFEHNKYLRLEKFKSLNPSLYKECMIIPCEVVSVNKNEATVKSEFFEGYKKLKTDFVRVKPGDKITKHYDYACEKINNALYEKIVRYMQELLKDKIGVLLPAYNEEKNIKAVIRGVKKYLPDSKIVVIDDGSSDRTYEIAKRTGVTVLRHEVNKGKGEALNTGFEYFLKNCPEVEIVVVADTDRQYSIDEIVKIVRPLKNKEADFVMGCRNWRKVPYTNAMGNFVWRMLFNFFFKTKLKDTNCGYLGLTRKAIKKIGRVHGGYIIENSMLRDVVKNEMKIKQVQVNVKYRNRRIPHFLRMFFGVLIFIIVEGFKYRLSKF